MKILVAHNQYQQRGGEDSVVCAEIELMRSHGHDVVYYERRNQEIREKGSLGAIEAGVGAVWGTRSLGELREIVGREKPRIAHFHNTFPLFSPAVYDACFESGVPVVQTLHNYRLLCPAATLHRKGEVCEECLGRRVAWPGVAHACYRGSRLATAAVATMLATHRWLKTWDDKVNRFIALSEFARAKFVEGGLPADRFVVKPNFVGRDPGAKHQSGNYVLFAGRVAEEKGLRTLMEAWGRLKQQIPLRIAGDGPLKEELTSAAQGSGIEWLGALSAEQMVRTMQGARFLVFPSVWFEGFPMTIAEAFACGLAVISSRLGSLTEIVQDGVTGLHFVAGDGADLSRKVEWAWSHVSEMDSMGRKARLEYEEKYTADRNYHHIVALWNGLGLNCDN